MREIELNWPEFRNVLALLLNFPVILKVISALKIVPPARLLQFLAPAFRIAAGALPHTQAKVHVAVIVGMSRAGSEESRVYRNVIAFGHYQWAFSIRIVSAINKYLLLYIRLLLFLIQLVFCCNISAWLRLKWMISIRHIYEL